MLGIVIGVLAGAVVGALVMIFVVRVNPKIILSANAIARAAKSIKGAVGK